MYGPENRQITLASTVSSYQFSLNLEIEPLTWISWSQTVEIRIDNTGGVPVISTGLGLSIDDTIIGWINTPPDTLVMPGEAKSITGKVQILGEFRGKLAGKTLPIKINLSAIGIVRGISYTYTIAFPK